MKRSIPLLAVLALPAFAQEPAPAAAPAPGPAPASAPAARPALPAPGRVLLPHGPKWDALPADEKEHIRKMAEFKAARDAAEQDLLRLDDEAQARKEEICKENEEAGKLRARIDELQAEFAAATNALEKIYRADEALAKIAGQIEPARKIVEASQDSLNKEVVAAMHKRMAAQRAAWDKDHPVPDTPEARAAAVGMTPEAFSNLMERARGAAPAAPRAPAPGLPLPPGRDGPPPGPRAPAPAAPAPAPAPAPSAE